jgi:carbon storage regulator
MLVLSRRKCERIHVGDGIVLTVLRVKGGTVRIGVEAPKDVRVWRSEEPKKAA